MVIYAERILEEIIPLPYGDPEKDHVILDKHTVETLRLCLETIQGEWPEESSLTILLTTLINRWETIEGLWYA